MWEAVLHEVPASGFSHATLHARIHGNGTSCDIYESGAAEKIATDRSGRRSARAALLRSGRCCVEVIGEASPRVRASTRAALSAPPSILRSRKAWRHLACCHDVRVALGRGLCQHTPLREGSAPACAASAQARRRRASHARENSCIAGEESAGRLFRGGFKSDKTTVTFAKIFPLVVVYQ